MYTKMEYPGAVELSYAHEFIRIEAWGRNALRVRIGPNANFPQGLGALEAAPLSGLGATSGASADPLAQASEQAEATGNEPCSVTEIPGYDRPEEVFSNGRISVVANLDGGTGIARFLLDFQKDGESILREAPEHFWWPGAHGIYPGFGGHEVHQCFASDPAERFYGMGQHSYDFLDHKGVVSDLVQRNGEVSIPFVLSDKGYGFLWNNPSVGRVEFAKEATRWVAQASEWIDYWVCVGDTPKEILQSYADAVGHAPRIPQWALGLWQSKLRYTSQNELMEVAREYYRRGLPLSVIVTDFIHWPAMGEWRFDPSEYPDPEAMMAELEEMGTKLMVSVWPTVSPLAETDAEIRAKGLLVGTEAGVEYHQTFRDKGMDRPLPVAFYDPTNPAAREYVWNKLKNNYFDLGVRVFWLDACEPELNPGHPSNLRFYAGKGLNVSNLYPRENARMIWEGMREEGEDEFLTLCRSAWAGQAKYGAAVWSGDIGPTWEALYTQVRAGQSIGISGIPWWTSDIGGFHGGDASDPAYQELFARWFEFGTFCPLMRVHGHREPREDVASENPGGPNEIWSYGEEVADICSRYILLRETLRPYLTRVMDEASERGIPAMRALFLEFPEDERCWSWDGEFFLGPDLLVSPITEAGSRTARVYLPRGARWRQLLIAPSCGDEDQEATASYMLGETFEGGSELTIDAPLECIPLFIRENTDLDSWLTDNYRHSKERKNGIRI